jgi:hypothetical protein
MAALAEPSRPSRTPPVMIGHRVFSRSTFSAKGEKSENRVLVNRVLKIMHGHNRLFYRDEREGFERTHVLGFS